jgi:hypothetical protein
MAPTLRLRRGEMDDLDGLYALATIPRVYRYVFDGEPPSREYIAQRLALRVSDSPVRCFRLWFLQDGSHQHAGVELRPYETPRMAEITPGCYIPIFGDTVWRCAWRGARLRVHLSRDERML